MSERVPAHSIEAEEAVLGAMLLSAEALQRGLHLVDAEDFWRTAHRVTWRAMQALHAKGQPVDAITVQAELASRKQLDDVGGAAFLLTLVQAPPTVASIDYYARIVAELARRRRMIDLGTRITQAGY